MATHLDALIIVPQVVGVVDHPMREPQDTLLNSFQMIFRTVCLLHDKNLFVGRYACWWAKLPARAAGVMALKFRLTNFEYDRQDPVDRRRRQ